MDTTLAGRRERNPRDAELCVRRRGKRPARLPATELTLPIQRFALESEQLLLDHPTHQSLRVRRLRALARLTLEPIRVDQRHEQLEVLRLARVRRRRHQEQMPGDAAKQLAKLVA